MSAQQLFVLAWGGHAGLDAAGAWLRCATWVTWARGCLGPLLPRPVLSSGACMLLSGALVAAAARKQRGSNAPSCQCMYETGTCPGVMFAHLSDPSKAR